MGRWNRDIDQIKCRENRILTADHVALFKNEIPETIYAFHASGYLLAEVEPVVFVPQDSEKTIKGDYRYHDISVLAPTKFYSEAAETYWQENGASLAQEQSSTMLQAFLKDTDIAIAHGSSGGALFNKDGEVAGVMTELIRSNFLDDWTLKDSGFFKIRGCICAYTG